MDPIRSIESDIHDLIRRHRGELADYLILSAVIMSGMCLMYANRGDIPIQDVSKAIKCMEEQSLEAVLKSEKEESESLEERILKDVQE